MCNLLTSYGGNLKSINHYSYCNQYTRTQSIPPPPPSALPHKLYTAEKLRHRGEEKEEVKEYFAGGIQSQMELNEREMRRVIIAKRYLSRDLVLVEKEELVPSTQTHLKTKGSNFSGIQF